MKIVFPEFNVPAPTPNKQLLTIPGVNGDYSDNNHTYGAVDVAVGVVIRIPERYRMYQWFEAWAKLKSDIANWLYGDQDWLQFGLDPDFLYRAEVMQAPQFTPVNTERINSTITFHFQPFKYEVDAVNWIKFPSSGVTYNKENVNVRPDWHLNGTGNFVLHVNDVPYEFDNLDSDLYLIGDEGNAYRNDPEKLNTSNELLNYHLRLANNQAPQLLCAGDGANTLSIEAMDSDSHLNSIEFRPKYRGFI